MSHQLPKKLPIAEKGDALVWNDVVRTINSIIEYLESTKHEHNQHQRANTR